jgi:hypothetical protein
MSRRSGPGMFYFLLLYFLLMYIYYYSYLRRRDSDSTPRVHDGEGGSIFGTFSELLDLDISRHTSNVTTSELYLPIYILKIKLLTYLSYILFKFSLIY